MEFDSAATEPESPQELHVEAVSSTEIMLSWTPGSDNGSPVTGYRLLVHELASESRSASKHLIAQHQIASEVVSFVASKLKPETLYELEIVAQNSVGTSESVSMRCETFASPPDAPELSLLQAQSSVLKLKWQQPASSSATVEPCYFYLEKENDFGTFSPVFEGESKMAKIKGLREQAVHRFRIRSAHAKGVLSLMGPWSPTYEFATTRPPPPAVKGSLMVSEVSQSVFQIEWTPIKMVSSTNVGEDGTELYVYRLQVTPKVERRGVVEPWKTVSPIQWNQDNKHFNFRFMKVHVQVTHLHCRPHPRQQDWPEFLLYKNSRMRNCARPPRQSHNSHPAGLQLNPHANV